MLVMSLLSGFSFFLSAAHMLDVLHNTPASQKKKYESNSMKDKIYQKPVEQPGQKMAVS